MNKVSGNNITYRIVQSLGKKIVCGEFSRSEPLPSETQLCSDYSASRTVLREAVKMLTAKGLLDARPRRGTIIRPEKEWNFTDPDIIDWLLLRKHPSDIASEFLDFQLANIPTIGALAQRRLDKDAFDKLQNYLQKISSSEIEAANDAEHRFHELLLTASDNRFMVCLKHVLVAGLKALQHTRDEQNVSREQVTSEYQQILQSLMSGDEQCVRFALSQFLMRYKMALLSDKA